MIALLESFFENGREAHGKNVTFKGAAGHPGKLVGFGKKAVEAAHLVERDFELMPEGAVDLEGALNEKFACGGVAAHCRDGKHGGTLDADRIKVVDGLRFFHRPFGRLRIGQHVPVGIALNPGGLGGTHFAVAATKHLPAEAGRTTPLISLTAMMIFIT